jgi:hypothetical protein
MADKEIAQSQEEDNKLHDTLRELNTRITKYDSSNKEKEYTKIIQKKFDGNEAPEAPERIEQIIKINLIAIIYKRNDNYELKFKIIKYNNEIDIAKFINEKSIYVYNRISTIIDKKNCINFNKVFPDNLNYNNFLRNINKQTNQNILYTLSYIFENITYNIQLSIPIIIILTGNDKLIMIDYSKSNIPIGTFTDTDTNKNIDLTLLSIISTQLFTTITKYLKDNFENELDELLGNYNDERIFNIGVDPIGKKYRTTNNIDSIINKK